MHVKFLRTHIRICHSIQIYAAMHHTASNHQSIRCRYIEKFRCHWRSILSTFLFSLENFERVVRAYFFFILCNLCAPSTTYFEMYDKIDVFFVSLFLCFALSSSDWLFHCHVAVWCWHHVSYMCFVSGGARARAWRLNISSATISIEFTDCFVVVFRCRTYI